MQAYRLEDRLNLLLKERFERITGAPVVIASERNPSNNSRERIQIREWRTPLPGPMTSQVRHESVALNIDVRFAESGPQLVNWREGKDLTRLGSLAASACH